MMADVELGIKKKCYHKVIFCLSSFGQFINLCVYLRKSILKLVSDVVFEC